MSKPRSYLFNYAAKKRREVRGFTTEVHFGKQAKHLRRQKATTRLNQPSP